MFIVTQTGAAANRHLGKQRAKKNQSYNSSLLRSRVVGFKDIENQQPGYSIFLSAVTFF